MAAPVTTLKLENPPAELVREPLVQNFRSPGWISDAIAGVSEGKTTLWWKVSFGISVTMMTVCFSLITYLVSTGVGVWGLGHPVMWGWAIINFVWWIGIGTPARSFPRFSFCCANAGGRGSIARPRR